jgi:hypothetical protein
MSLPILVNRLAACLFFCLSTYATSAQFYMGVGLNSLHTQNYTFSGGSPYATNSASEAILHFSYRFKTFNQSPYKYNPILAFEPGSVVRLTTNTATLFMRLPLLFGTSQPILLRDEDKSPVIDFTSYVGYQVKLPYASSFITSNNYSLHGFIATLGVGFYSKYGQKLDIGYMLDFDLATAKGRNYGNLADPNQFIAHGLSLRLTSDIVASHKFQKEYRAQRKAERKARKK